MNMFQSKGTVHVYAFIMYYVSTSDIMLYDIWVRSLYFTTTVCTLLIWYNININKYLVPMCYVPMCYVLFAICYVLCAMCYVLCAMCYVLSTRVRHDTTRHDTPSASFLLWVIHCLIEQCDHCTALRSITALRFRGSRYFKVSRVLRLMYRIDKNVSFTAKLWTPSCAVLHS